MQRNPTQLTCKKHFLLLRFLGYATALRHWLEAQKNRYA
jgi:hypothetical protein